MDKGDQPDGGHQANDEDGKLSRQRGQRAVGDHLVEDRIPLVVNPHNLVGITQPRHEEWIDELVVGGTTQNTITRVENCSGTGLTEAARGALGHWLEITNGVVSRYQCVVQTTWNCSPRDDFGQPGALEQALVGAPVADPDNPIEPVRVVRSFDPCLSCAVH